MGYNISGGLGLGHVARANQPIRARLPEGTADVQSGGEFTVARTFSGELYAVRACPVSANARPWPGGVIEYLTV